MKSTQKTIEQSRLEIVLLATGVLALVSLLSVLVFINLGPRSKANSSHIQGYLVPAWKDTPDSSDSNKSTEVQQHKAFIDNVRRRSAPTTVNGTKEMLTLRRRIMLWTSGERIGEEAKQNDTVVKPEKESPGLSFPELQDTDAQDYPAEHRDSLELHRSIVARHPTNEIVTRSGLFGWR